MPQVKFTQRSLQDLSDIRDFIKQDSPENAERFVQRLEGQCLKLSLHPYVGRLRTDVPGRLRSIAFGRYVIFYKPVGGTVIVVAVVHGARDISRALSDQ